MACDFRVAGKSAVFGQPEVGLGILPGAGGDIGTALWTCIGYTVLLCFTLFKTSSVAKSVFNAR